MFTAISFFALGLIKGKVVDTYPIRSGLNTLMIGGLAALVSFLVGSILSVHIGQKGNNDTKVKTKSIVFASLLMLLFGTV